MGGGGLGGLVGVIAGICGGYSWLLSILEGCF
jgi:hypothetical protein